jgi:hypothetical protein
MNIRCNHFVLRQVAGSPFSHFDGTWAELEELAHQALALRGPWSETAEPILCLPVNPYRFHSGIVEVTTETQLVPSFASRAISEAPFIDVRAKGKKLRALNVDLILYSHAHLGADVSYPDSTLEIVSINARITTAAEPMTPMAMARNYLGLPGGSPRSYTPLEFAQSIHFWSTHAMCAEEK